MGKGRYSHAAAQAFRAELGVGPGEWHCRWNDEAPGLREPVIPGRWGELYPFGRGKLGLHVRGPTAYRVNKVRRENPRWELLVDCDYEAIFVAPASDFGAAARAVKAWRRKRYELSRGEKARRVARMAAGRRGRKRATEDPAISRRQFTRDSRRSDVVSGATAEGRIGPGGDRRF